MHEVKQPGAIGILVEHAEGVESAKMAAIFVYQRASEGVRLGVCSTRMRRHRNAAQIPAARKVFESTLSVCSCGKLSTLRTMSIGSGYCQMGQVQRESSDRTPDQQVTRKRSGLLEGSPKKSGSASIAKRLAPSMLPWLFRVGSPFGLCH
jgi:hypothetical protein